MIPAYNAGQQVAATISRVLAAPLPELERVVVVNDGSRDDTGRIVEGLPPARCPVELVDRPQNGGYGAAMKDGLRRAREAGPEFVACVHADGQYSPEALPALLASMRTRHLDLLQGSRVASGTALSGGMPLYKYVANAALNILENRTLGLSMTDYHSGYLLYGRSVLDTVPFARLSDSFDFDLEVIASARACGLGVGEEPVRTHYGDEVSHLRPIPYGLRVMRVLWRFRRGYYGVA